MKDTLTEKEILKMLTAACKGMTRSELSRKIGCTPQYLYDVMNGNRPPGPKICRYLGIEKRETYEYAAR